MLPVSPRNLPPEERTLGDEERHQTSIRVHPDLSPLQEIKLEKITQDAGPTGKNYSGRLSKERYPSSRASLPVGNFDWTEHRPRGTGGKEKEKERKQWTWKQRLLLGLLILALTAGVTVLAIYLLSPKESSLHETSVEPRVPTFIEMSGRMNAPKLQPLVQVDEDAQPAETRHLLKVQ